MTTATPAPARKRHLTTPHPDTAQAVFRQCLDACARPGTVQRLGTPEGLESLVAGRPAAVAPVLALADLMTPVVPVTPETAALTGQEAGQAEKTEETVAELLRLTGAPRGTLGDARIALSLGPPDPAAMQLLNTGTALAPHHGVLLCQQVMSVAGPGDPPPAAPGSVDVRLSGPGLRSSTTASVAGVDPAFFAVRADLVSGFPTGIDVLFVSDRGDVLGVPRTTKVEVL